MSNVIFHNIFKMIECNVPLTFCCELTSSKVLEAHKRRPGVSGLSFKQDSLLKTQVVGIAAIIHEVCFIQKS